MKYGKYIFIKYAVFHKYKYVFVKYISQTGKYAHARYLDAHCANLMFSGPFQKIQIISFIQDEVFIYDEILRSIFRWNLTENLFESLLSVEQRITSMDVDFCEQWVSI